MKAYRIKETEAKGPLEGRILVPIGTETILSATCTVPQAFYSSWTLDRMKQESSVDEIELKDEKWIHPHLHKRVKAELVKELT